jgi:23S rRNA (cytosine1962-C5)-methyltransferase
MAASSSATAQYRFIRPEPQAMWAPASDDWDAHGEFLPGPTTMAAGAGYFAQADPARRLAAGKWEEVRFTAQTTPFRHLGFFPDMAPVWSWMRAQTKGIADKPEPCMNLFGYTGVGTLAMAAKGARMTHVDASKKSVAGGQGQCRALGMEDCRSAG